MAFDIITYALLKRKNSQLQSQIDTLNGDETVDGSVENKIAEAIAGSPEEYQKLQEIADWLAQHGDESDILEQLADLQDNKQDKLTAGQSIDISPSGGDLVISLVMDAALADDSTNPVSGAVIKAAVDELLTAVNEAKQDVQDLDDKITQKIQLIDGKQDKLIPGDNITLDRLGNISATDTTYSAGTGISIDNQNNISVKRRELTKQQYDALSQSEKNNGTEYFVTDENPVDYSAGENVIIDSNRTISIDTESTLVQSGKPIQSKVVYDALQNKQDVLTPGEHIRISNNTVSSIDSQYTAGANITITKLQEYLDNVELYQIDATNTEYTAGDNITIENNTISAKDTIYNDEEIRAQIGATNLEVNQVKDRVSAVETSEVDTRARVAVLEGDPATKVYNIEYETYEDTLSFKVVSYLHDVTNHILVSDIKVNNLNVDTIPDFYHTNVAIFIDNDAGLDIGAAVRFYWEDEEDSYLTFQSYDLENPIPVYGVATGQYPGVGKPVIAYNAILNQSFVQTLKPGYNITIDNDIISAKNTVYNFGHGLTQKENNVVVSDLYYNSDEQQLYNNDAAINPKTNATQVAYGGSNVAAVLNGLQTTADAIQTMQLKDDSQDASIQALNDNISTLNSTIREIDGNYLPKVDPVYEHSLSQKGCSAQGSNSLAVGHKTVARSTDSVAMGSESTATGGDAFAMGLRNHAYAYYSIAMGLESSANDTYSMAVGNKCVTNGAGGIALGNACTAGADAFAVGAQSSAENSGYSIGKNNTIATGSAGIGTNIEIPTGCSGCVALGSNLQANASKQIILGAFNALDSTKIFMLGNGTQDNDRKNLLTVDELGKVEALNGFYVNGVKVSLPEYDATNEGNVLKIVNGIPTWVAE